MILPDAPERYDRDYMTRLVRALELAVTTLEQTTLKGDGQHTALASTTAVAGFALGPGVAPTTPVDGQIWLLAAGGLYYRSNGITTGPVT